MFNINYKATQLPLQRTKGTFAIRMQKSNRVNAVFFNEIKDKFVNKEMSLQEFATYLKKIVPENINLDVDKYKKNGVLSLSSSDAINIDGYKIKLELNKPTKKININSAGTFMHETQHLFDSLFNPKFLARTIAILNNQKTNITKLDKFYDNCIYNTSNLTMKKLNEFLKNMPIKVQIDFLQDSRYRIYSEQNAYISGKKYQREIDTLYKQDNFIGANVKYGKYKFPQKIKILEQKLAEILTSERAKLKKENKH